MASGSGMAGKSWLANFGWDNSNHLLIYEPALAQLRAWRG
jgi:hypothetical protein